MNEMQLSWYQALQLVALGPCLFMVFFLCVAARKTSQIYVPILYFLCLICSFLLPLRELLGGDKVHALLLLGANMSSSASFLLIVQCMTGAVPRPVYWTILAVPLIGGSQIAYAAAMTENEVCLSNYLCTTPLFFQKLYNIFSISLVSLLTLAIYRRLRRTGVKEPVARAREKYALVLALVGLNLALLAVDLMQLGGYTDQDHVRVAKTVLRIGFIYVALTLLFRMFDRPVELAYDRVPAMKPAEPSAKDAALADQIRGLFENEKLYRDMKLDRPTLARRLAVTEATLSRVVNVCFQENVSMLINQYRVEEARARLASETTPITAIAFEVGFSSIPSFNRVFRQFSEMSPSEYRQTRRSA